jgi:crotonobetainyl-CoA:carnitine CoA-transferase CaiB-like acyl-CoA transferase
VTVPGPGTKRGPLAGVRVLELASIGPGPFCAMMLADQGATVLRIDRPGAGDSRPERAFMNRGRQSAVLDLKHPRATDALLRLIDAADVLLEGFRPGVTERLGVGSKTPIEIRSSVMSWCLRPNSRCNAAVLYSVPPPISFLMAFHLCGNSASR